MAKAYFIPNREGDLIIWLENFIAKIDGHSGALNLDPATVGALIAAAQAIIDDINATAQAKLDAQEATTQKNQTKKDNLSEITSKVTQFKEEPTYTEAIGNDLEVIGPEEGFDPISYQPTLSVQNIQQGRLLKFSKSKTDGVNVYRRIKGEPTWTFLALDTKSPYLDSEDFPSPTEVEYKVVGVIDNEEIGVDSDIVDITTAEVS